MIEPMVIFGLISQVPVPIQKNQLSVVGVVDQRKENQELGRNGERRSVMEPVFSNFLVPSGKHSNGYPHFQ